MINFFRNDDLVTEIRCGFPCESRGVFVEQPSAFINHAVDFGVGPQVRIEFRMIRSTGDVDFGWFGISREVTEIR